MQERNGLYLPLGEFKQVDTAPQERTLLDSSP